ncbi:hypothetical protein QQM79_03665 [Marinobacteraceae bacterium S3BR75-40.1]
MKNAEVRFVLVYRKTRLQELVERFNTWPQAQFYLEHNNVDVQDYLREHDHYQQQLQTSERALKALGPVQILERAYLPSYQFSQRDIVVVIGQDGLVANCLKYLDGQPVLGVNPDPARWDGKLLRFEVPEMTSAVNKVLKDHAASKTVRFAEAFTNDGQCIRAVNDLFIGPKTHTSARYIVRWNEEEEAQSSSGIIVSTGFGSTGWFQSILAGSMAVAGIEDHPMRVGFPWDASFLQFSVREPFPSKTSGTRLIFGRVDEDNPLTLESMMPENGVIFSDGIEQDYLQFNSGCIAKVGMAETQGQLIW